MFAAFFKQIAACFAHSKSFGNPPFAASNKSSNFGLFGCGPGIFPEEFEELPPGGGGGGGGSSGGGGSPAGFWSIFSRK